MVTAQVLDAAASETATPSAVVWINGRHAFVALMSDDGRISTCEITRGWFTETAYLAQVVHVIGDRQRVVILGPSSARLALEREYVAVFKRPPLSGGCGTSGVRNRMRIWNRRSAHPSRCYRAPFLLATKLSVFQRMPRSREIGWFRT
jgi:hypothetical protein